MFSLVSVYHSPIGVLEKKTFKKQSAQLYMTTCIKLSNDNTNTWPFCVFSELYRDTYNLYILTLDHYCCFWLQLSWSTAVRWCRLEIYAATFIRLPSYPDLTAFPAITLAHGCRRCNLHTSTPTIIYGLDDADGFNNMDFNQPIYGNVRPIRWDLLISILEILRVLQVVSIPVIPVLMPFSASVMPYS
jgi:hypothetical protein